MIIYLILRIIFFFDYIFIFFFLLIWVFISFFNYSWRGVFILNDSLIFVLLVLISIFILGVVLFRELNDNLIILSILLVLVRILFFYSFNIIILYIFFELSIFPIIIIILGYGSQIEKINSTYYLLFYASFCSFPFLYIYFNYDLNFILPYFDKIISWELILFLSLGFIIKFPVYFLHLWLPKAHVEAPTTARILLAGLLLKLGTGGFLRIIKSFSFIHSNYWFLISFMGIVIGSFSCIYQRDTKSLAAYSSITHIGFLLICLVFISIEGKISRLIIILSHGYTSTLIFYFIGEYYHSSNRRIVYYLNRIFNIRLILGIIFSLTFLRNAGVPPSLRFFAEFISISFGLNLLNLIIIVLFFYFFFAFYYSIYFITNFLIGKNFILLNFWSSYYSYFFVIIIFNIFWIRLIF